ncbi:HK97 family phage prohead protease [Sphingobium sp. CFD-2]|uniref:HK97 family phage prohead protease n=1 Tax=Sphingobium sp. CFD-2 TaxID=2878542 RepID=UPI00214B80CC|nr:HK97 family phage prohead protease [Sphingobium sp. CFD-2]
MTMLTKNSGVPLDIKAVSDDGSIEGYGSVFGNVDSYGEVVEPGAFTQSLVDAKRKGQTIKMLWQHDRERPIGVWEDLAEDSKGLWVKGRLAVDVSPLAKETHGLLKMGALDGLSIGYRTLDAEPHATKPNVLSLKRLLLKEVSVVTFAANDRARVESVKQILAAGNLPTVREFEEFLRDAGGFSKSLAAAIAAKATPHLRGEPEAKADDEVMKFLKAMQA